MKYDVLNEFKKYLKKQVEKERFSQTTVNSYYSSLNKALEKLDFDEASELNLKDNKNHLYSYIKNKKRQNPVSKVKNALRLLGECTDYKYEEDKEYLSTVVSSKSKMRLTKSKEIEVAKANRKIASLKNSDMKKYLGFKIMQLSGIRVGTMSKLDKKDFSIEGNKVKINLRKEITKGKKDGSVELLEDNKFVEDLKAYLASAPDKLFCHKNTYIKKATELGIKSHNFRRVCAKIVFRKAIREGKSRQEAKEQVKKQLCHSKTTYKKYLSAKANFKDVDLSKFYKHRRGNNEQEK